MTIYEQVQRALDVIEDGLSEALRIEQVAAAAFMSVRSFCNYFWAVTGFTYKEYLIKRRLAESLPALAGGREKIIDIALRSGYESHEAFSRAFKKEFGIAPIRFRAGRPEPRGLEKIQLVKEMYMGVIVKELPEMNVLCFDGFAPEPEFKAQAALEKWLEQTGYGKPYRVFGHNIDERGNLSHDPHNIGYRVLVTVEPGRLGDEDRGRMKTIAPGKFVATGIEGDISTGDGTWIMEGWRRMNEMIAKKGYRVHDCPRWFEEVLEPSRPGLFRLDLYAEIER